MVHKKWDIPFCRCFLHESLHVDVKVLDIELLDTTKHKDSLGTFISDLVLQVFLFVVHQERENIKQRQKEETTSANNKGIKFGRPKLGVLTYKIK